MMMRLLKILAKKRPNWYLKSIHQRPPSADDDHNQNTQGDLRRYDVENPQGSVREREPPNASIDEDLAQANISQETRAWDKVSIYRIPECLREAAGDHKAYTPQIVSLGPYHHGKKRLRWMEQHKHRALNQILRRNQATPEVYMKAVKPLEKRARDCYEGPICACKVAAKADHTEKCSKDFIRMMVVDSCFILELFLGSVKGFTMLGYSKHDPIFAMRATMHMIQRDMIMLENQIPLFVLNTLFTLQIEGNMDQKGVLNLNQLAFRFFDPLTPTYDPSKEENDGSNSESPPPVIERYPETLQLHLLEVFRRNLLGIPIERKEAKPVADKRRQHVIPCVTRLRQEGITFKSRETDKFWDIKFENGILKIPRLLIHSGTKSLFLNLIAYEQCHVDSENEITSYLIFMDNLIDNPEDVTYLYTHGIIEHWLGSDAEVAELFNQLCQEVVFDRKGSYLYEVSRKVNMYHRRKWNGWRANLKHRYFNNPWSITSFIAAVVLLLLTAAQTFYALYAYYRPPR